ncbi:MAG: hypothetical protein V4590_00840 [Bacteroidota bacterium]
MKKLLFALLLAYGFMSMAQPTTSDTAKVIPARILIVPHQTMMHFSDADEDISRFSHKDVSQVRNALRLDLESNVHHQLLANFDAISLLRSTTTNGEEDLNKIYAATRYTIYSRQLQEEYHAEKKSPITTSLKNISSTFKRKNKEQTFWVSDSSVMLGAIGNRELFQYLHKKYNEKYILFITQFEINTSNKNSIEWLKQSYTREYTVHYNLFDYTGALIRAEMITIKAGNENTPAEIKSKYLILLAQRLKEIVQVANN